MKDQKSQSKRKNRETLDEPRVSFYNVSDIYEKTLTKTVGYILKSKRVRDGESLIRVEYI